MKYVLLALLSVLTVTARAETLVYIGTYTQRDGGSEGIYVSKLQQPNGALSPPVLAAKVENPSFVALHPTRPLLYAVSEVGGDDEETVGVLAFAIEDDGKLRKLNERSTKGGAACHLSVDPSGRCVAVANYTGGSCASFPIEEDGSLGKMGSFHQHVGGSGSNPRRQKEPHAHSINFNEDGSQAFVADLGKDQILIYDVDAKAGTMEPADPEFVALPAGGGPRHFSFHPSFEHAFSNLEMTSMLGKLSYDRATGELKLDSVVATIPESAKEQGNSTAECLVHPSGKFVYVSNRGHNSIAVFQFDSEKGELTPLGNTSTEGEIPRGFGIDPSGKFLIAGNQRSGNVVSFHIDPEQGTLTPTGSEIEVGSPVNVRFYER